MFVVVDSFTSSTLGANTRHGKRKCVKHINLMGIFSSTLQSAWLWWEILTFFLTLNHWFNDWLHIMSMLFIVNFCYSVDYLNMDNMLTNDENCVGNALPAFEDFSGSVNVCPPSPLLIHVFLLIYVWACSSPFNWFRCHLNLVLFNCLSFSIVALFSIRRPEGGTRPSSQSRQS